MTEQQISNTFTVEVAGTEIPDSVAVVEVEVDTHLQRPDSFTVTMSDPANDVLVDAGARIGEPVTISMLSDATTTPVVLIRGEITAVETEILGGSTSTVMRGYDQSHRLYRGRSTASYLNVASSDIAKTVAERAGLGVGSITATRPTHDHVTQANESDWTFLNRLARDVGFEVIVDDEKLSFGPPSSSDGAPGESDLTSTDPLTLHAGSKLLYLHATVTAADQVKQVNVRSWDPKAKRTLTATAAAQTNAATNGHSPSELADAFGGPVLTEARTPYATTEEVEAAATALMDEVASSYTEVEAQARGNPQLRAGVAIQLGLLGDPFDGKYVLTEARHRWTREEGYVTSFVVSGRQDRSTLRLTGGDAQQSRMPGVVPAIVDDVSDPEELCRVRVRLPWMDDSFVSDWTRVVQAGAGKQRGFVVMPEVGDEVLVAFEHGDPRRPYVLGGLYNSEDTPSSGPSELFDSSSRELNHRLFTSRLGHQLVFTDADQGCGITMHSADGKISLQLNQETGHINIVSGANVTVTAEKDLVLTAGGDVTIEGAAVSLTAQGAFSAEGASVAVKGSGQTEITGQPVKLN